MAINETSIDQGLPAAAAPQPVPARQPAAVAADQEPVGRARALRIGDRVRSLVDDVCVSVGLDGLVVNVAPPRYSAPARARILWDNETVSMADATTFEQLTGRETTATDEQSRVA